MASIRLAAVLGGETLLGITSAVTFATILAVVAGLTLSAAAAISYDLYRRAWKRGSASDRPELRVSRIATLVFGLSVVMLAIAFQHESVGFLATLPLVIAASVNFPLLVLSMYWPGLTTRGTLSGGITGLIPSVGLLVLSRRVWVDLLGHTHAVFPYEYPTVFSMTAAVLAVAASMTDTSPRANERPAGLHRPDLGRRARSELAASGARSAKRPRIVET